MPIATLARLSSSPTTASGAALALIATLLCGSGCGDGGGGDGNNMMQPMPDLLPEACNNPCEAVLGVCPDKGPPDYAKAMGAKHAPSSDDDQKAAIDRANYFRVSMGLPPFDGNDLINKAAIAHAEFLAKNQRRSCYPDSPHDEVEGCPGYTGFDVKSRLTTAGFKGSPVSEVITEGPINPAAAVDNWIFSVYHRLPFADFRLTQAGFGISDRWVMNFGTPAGTPTPTAPGIIVFPVPGQIEVPPEFEGFTETPTPPGPAGQDPWPQGVPSGQVISVHFPSLAGMVTEHKLYNATDGCTPVDTTYTDDRSDPALMGTHSAFFYADEPLAPNTVYVVQVKGMFNKEGFTRTWSFTTQ